MLDPFIIDHLRRLAEEKRQLQQPQLELELPRPMPNTHQDDPENQSGVLVIELL